MLEIFNQISIFVAKKNFKTNFWDTEPFILHLPELAAVGMLGFVD